MTKFLLAFFSLFLLSGCASQSPSAPEPTEEPSDDRVIMEGEAGTEIEETAHDDGSYTFTILSGGKEVAQIEKESSHDGYQAYVFEQIDEKAYIAVDPTGLGGYILYSGAFELYEVNTETGAVRQLMYYGQALDISDRGTDFVYSVGNEVGEMFMVVASVQPGGEFVEYQVPAEFDQAGDARFSPDGTKVAYQATITSDGSEETAVIVIDLTTGEQTEFGRQEGLYEIEWQDNDRPIL